MTAQNWTAKLISIPIVVYVFYVIIKSLCETEASFCGIGYTLLGALIIGAVTYLKFGWQR